METLPDYKPLSKEQHKRINALWQIYRESVGLEGDLLHTLIAKGVPENNIRVIMERRKREVQGDLEAWRDLRGENF